MAGTCDYGNELSGSIKCGKFLDYLRTGQLFKKDCAPWSKYRIFKRIKYVKSNLITR